MKDQSKTKQVLIQELASLRQRISELERSESERKNLEEALRESEEFLSNLLEYAPFSIYVTGADGRMRLMNQRWEADTGRRRSECLGQPLDQEFSAERARKYQAENQKIIETGASLTFEEVTEAPTGPHHFFTVKFPLRDGSGRVEAVGGISLDITERKRVEEMLRQSEEKWRSLVSTLPDFIALHDREGRYLFLNHYAEGFTEKNVLGKKGYEFVSQESRELYRTTFEECIRTVTKQHSEYSAMGNYEKARMYESTFVPIIGYGNEINVLVVAKDITERKRVEETLRRSEENFRNSLDDSPLGVRIVTIEGETIYANRAILDIYGYDSLEELNINPVNNRYTPESYAEFQIRREKRKRGKYGPSKYDISIVRKDCEVRHLQVFRKEVLWNDERQFQVVYQDITERKQAEERLWESEEQSRLLATYHKRLNDIFIAFVEASGTEELFDRIASSFRILTGAIAATFSVYNQETRNLKAASLSIDPISGDKVGSIFGPDLFEMRMPVSADDMGQMFSQGIKKPKDLCELSFGVIPQEISDGIMDAVGCRQIVALAIIYVEELFGTCVAYLPEDKPVVPDDALKVYAYLSGLAVKRRQVDEALQAAEKRYRSLFENSIMGISQVHPDGRLIVVNNAYAQMCGYANAEEMMAEVSHVGKLHANPGDWEEVLRILREKGIMKPREMAVVRRNGTRITVLTGAREIRDPNGNLLHYQAEQMDITERKRAEEALLESEARYRQLVEYAPAAIYEADLTTGRLLSVNEVLCKYSGYTRDELLALHPIDLMTEESRKLILQRMARYTAGEPVPPNVEYKARSKTGREFWISTNAKYFYQEGLPVRATVVAYDITERKKAEEELRTSHLQLRALATRLQRIREEERIMIAREIHDEMGGGLTGLKMDLSWLLRKVGDADPCEERVALMDRIHTSNALIDQMIRVVRRISMDLRPSVLDDLGLIAALEWQLAEFTSHTEIPHEFATIFEYVNMEKDTAVAVFRIFQEALTNVVRHSRATKVAVVLREGERSLFGNESFVLEIRDNGRGITEEEILNPKSLGLLGMKERLLTFGGELSIRGEPGGGTALVLKIPLKQGETS